MSKAQVANQWLKNDIFLTPTMIINLMRYGGRLHKILQNTIPITKLNNDFIPSEVW